MRFGRTNPALRAVIAIALLVIGIVAHRLLLAAAAGVALLVSAGQWLYVTRRGARGAGPGDGGVPGPGPTPTQAAGRGPRGRRGPDGQAHGAGPPGRRATATGARTGIRTAGTPPDVIEVRHLTKRFGGFTAVDDVSFRVPAGQVTAVLGPNGAGKTTTIEIMEGFLAPSGGQVRVLGAGPRQGGRAGRAWRARIGLVLQSTSLDMQLTVAEALRLYAGLFSRPLPPGEVLGLIDLADDAGTKIGALSGGQRRRVDLGLAVIGRPEVLFLDEPRMRLGGI